jgi:hypothetical protein
MKDNILTEEQAALYAAMSDQPATLIESVTISEDGRSAIYAAMADEEAPERKGIDAEQTSRFVTLNLNGKVMVLPTMTYVANLERLVQTQARAIQRHERQFHRIAAILRNQRGAHSGTTSALADLQRDLDNKIDRRD